MKLQSTLKGSRPSRFQDKCLQWLRGKDQIQIISQSLSQVWLFEKFSRDRHQKKICQRTWDYHQPTLHQTKDLVTIKFTKCSVKSDHPPKMGESLLLSIEHHLRITKTWIIFQGFKNLLGFNTVRTREKYYKSQLHQETIELHFPNRAGDKTVETPFEKLLSKWILVRFTTKDLWVTTIASSARARKIISSPQVSITRASLTWTSRQLQVPPTPNSAPPHYQSVSPTSSRRGRKFSTK